MTFVNFKEGKLYVKKDGVAQFFSDLTGVLTDLNIVDDEYDNKKFKVLELRVVDGDETFLLKMRLESAYARMFCHQIENCTIGEPIMFCPAMSEENGKKQYKLFLRQDNKAMKHRYTKADPGDLPPLQKVTFKGEEHWDNTAAMTFYTELLIHKVKPSLQQVNSHPLLAGPATDLKGSGVPAGLSNRSSDPAADITEPIDDLPF